MAQDDPSLAVEVQQAVGVLVRDVAQESEQRPPNGEQPVVALPGSIDTDDQTGAGTSVIVNSRSHGAPQVARADTCCHRRHLQTVVSGVQQHRDKQLERCVNAH